MRVFNDLRNWQGEEAIESAVHSIAIRLEQLHLSNGQWSLAELDADDGDFDWLCKWAAHLDPGVAREWLTALRYVPLTGLDCSAPAGIGLLLMFVATELARRLATEGLLWGVVSRGVFSAETNRVLFVNGQPTAAHKDALEAAALHFNLRHVFGIEGLQNWFDTVYLQFGFTQKGFLRRLPEWLVSQGQTQAVVRLLLGSQVSPSFQRLWGFLKNFRKRNVTERQLRRIIEKSPWVLPEWADELVQCACKRPELVERPDDEERGPGVTPFLDEPTLQWSGHDPPVFVTRITNLMDLDLTAATYELLIGGEPSGRAIRQGDEIDAGYAAVPDEVVLSAAFPEQTAVLRGDNGDLRSMQVKLWERNEDVTLYHLPHGRRTANAWMEPMRLNRSYALLLSHDLELRPPPEIWRVLEGGRKLAMLPAGSWSPDTEVLHDGERLWIPGIEGHAATSDPPWALRTRLHVEGVGDQIGLGEETNVTIVHPDDAHVTFVRWDGRPIEFARDGAGGAVAGPVSVNPDPASRSLVLHVGLRRGTESAQVRRALELDLVGVAQLTTEGWHARAPEGALLVDEGQSELFRIFPPSRWEDRPTELKDWAVMEGNTWVGRVWPDSRSLGSLAGLGAPLTVRHGAYNAKEVALHVAGEVLNPGVVVDAALDKSKSVLEIHLSRHLDPDERHSVVCWMADGSAIRLPPELQDTGASAPLWRVAYPQGADAPLAAAIGYEGSRIGAWCRRNWSDWLPLVGETAPSQAAAMIRWLWLPLLSSQYRDDVRDFAHTHAPEVLPVWLDTEGPSLPESPSEALCWSTAGDAWRAAVRIHFREWGPEDPSVARELVGALTHSETGAPLLEAALKLMQVDPRLMGRVVDSWLAGMSSAGLGQPEDVDVAMLSPLECRRRRRTPPRCRDPKCPGAGPLLQLLKCRSAGATKDTEQALASRGEILEDLIAEIMKVDRYFVKHALIGPALRSFQGRKSAPVVEDNLALALSVPEFRQLLALRVIETIQNRRSNECLS